MKAVQKGVQERVSTGDRIGSADRQDSTNLLIVGILDEHVAKLNLGAVDVLTSDEYWETSTTTLPLEQGQDVAKLSREEGGKNRERSLCVKGVVSSSSMSKV